MPELNFFQIADEPAADNPGYDDSGCQCPPGDTKYLLGIEEGQAVLVHVACGKQIVERDWTDRPRTPSRSAGWSTRGRAPWTAAPSRHFEAPRAGPRRRVLGPWPCPASTPPTGPPDDRAAEPAPRGGGGRQRQSSRTPQKRTPHLRGRQHPIPAHPTRLRPQTRRGSRSQDRTHRRPRAAPGRHGEARYGLAEGSRTRPQRPRGAGGHGDVAELRIWVALERPLTEDEVSEHIKILRSARRMAVESIEVAVDTYADAKKRVTDLHAPVQHLGKTWCSECSVRRRTGPRTDEWVAFIPHPCPTIDALENKEPTT
jgi:hypothetical protein